MAGLLVFRNQKRKPFHAHITRTHLDGSHHLESSMSMTAYVQLEHTCTTGYGNRWPLAATTTYNAKVCNGVVICFRRVLLPSPLGPHFAPPALPHSTHNRLPQQCCDTIQWPGSVGGLLSDYASKIKDLINGMREQYVNLSPSKHAILHYAYYKLIFSRRRKDLKSRFIFIKCRALSLLWRFAECGCMHVCI